MALGTNSIATTFAPLVTAILSLAATGSAQVIVVDPGGGGQFTDLQPAIDAAPNFAIIEVRGGSYSNVTITNKSLRILGNPAATVAAPDNGVGNQPPAVMIRGTGVERVVFGTMNLGGGSTGGFGWGLVGPAIDAANLAELLLTDGSARATTYFQPTGIAVGAAGILARNVAVLRVQDSVVAGSTSDPGFGGGDPRLIPDGGDGIDAAGCVVEAMGATIQGGSVYSYTGQFGQPSPSPCPCPGWGGTGGNAVVATTFYNTASTLQPGSGAKVFYNPGGVPWGQMPSGQDFVGTQRQDLQLGLSTSAPMQLGVQWTAQLAPWVSPRAVLLGWPASSPIQVVQALVFLDVTRPIVVLPIGVSQTQLSFFIPTDPGLIGGRVVMQQVDAQFGSGPHYQVVRP